MINTHLHVDHVGWNTRLEGRDWVPTFPNAEAADRSPLVFPGLFSAAIPSAAWTMTAKALS